MTHPNQSFIDNFNIANKTDNSSPIYLYSSKFKEKQRKQKFQNFVENKQSNNPQTLNEDIKKIFDYNTLSKSKSKPIFEAKQSLGSLPDKFVYNGLLYQFNKELNIFVNQYNHTIEPLQASAFMDVAIGNFDASDMDASDTDGGGTPQNSIISNLPPNTPSNLSANISLSGITLTWESNSDNETGFKLYARRDLI